MDKIRSYFFTLLNILRNICSDYRSTILISQLPLKLFLLSLTHCVTYLNIFIIPLENISITSPLITSINTLEIIAFVPKWHFSYYSIIILFFNKLRSEKHSFEPLYEITTVTIAIQIKRPYLSYFTNEKKGLLEKKTSLWIVQHKPQTTCSLKMPLQWVSDR